MKFSSLDRRSPPIVDLSSEAVGRLFRSLIGAVVLAVGFSLLMSALARDVARSETPAKASLRAVVAVPDAVVTVGDFFENAGTGASTPLFRAPDLGTTGSVPAARVVELARAAGLRNADAGGLVEVQVSRLARPVESEELSRLIAAEALRQNRRDFEDTAVDDLRLTFDGAVAPLQADLRATEPARVVSLTLNARTGRFDAMVRVDQGEQSETVRLRGELVETVQVPVLTRALARGETAGRDDVEIDRLPKRRVGNQRPADVDRIVGMVARRPLRAGQPLSPNDFTRPILVTRGDAVTLVFEAPGLTVTGRGQALESGALGDVVGVLNPQSKRTVHATVAGPGRAVVGAGSRTVASIGRNIP